MHGPFSSIDFYKNQCIVLVMIKGRLKLSIFFLVLFLVAIFVFMLNFSTVSAYSTIGTAFGNASYGGYISDNWMRNLSFHSQYPYSNNYFGSAYDPNYNSYNSNFGYTGTIGGQYGVPNLVNLNDPRVFDEVYVSNPYDFFGLPYQPNSVTYANYNPWDVVDAYYGYNNNYNNYGNYGYNYDTSYNSYNYASSYVPVGNFNQFTNYANFNQFDYVSY